MKKYFILSGVVFLIIFSFFIYFRFFFTYEQRNRFSRSIEIVTGQNLKVTILDAGGKTVESWSGIQKISSGGPDRNYVFFYTKNGKYVQIPNSVWYIAEEE
jgi:hypothetical protein